MVNITRHRVKLVFDTDHMEKINKIWCYLLLWFCVILFSYSCLLVKKLEKFYFNTLLMRPFKKHAFLFLPFFDLLSPSRPVCFCSFWPTPSILWFVPTISVFCTPSLIIKKMTLRKLLKRSLERSIKAV